MKDEVVLEEHFGGATRAGGAGGAGRAGAVGRAGGAAARQSPDESTSMNHRQHATLLAFKRRMSAGYDL